MLKRIRHVGLIGMGTLLLNIVCYAPMPFELYSIRQESQTVKFTQAQTIQIRDVRSKDWTFSTLIEELLCLPLRQGYDQLKWFKYKQWSKAC